MFVELIDTIYDHVVLCCLSYRVHFLNMLFWCRVQGNICLALLVVVVFEFGVHLMNMFVFVKLLGADGLQQDPPGHAGPGQAYAIRLPQTPE